MVPAFGAGELALLQPRTSIGYCGVGYEPLARRAEGHLRIRGASCAGDPLGQVRWRAGQLRLESVANGLQYTGIGGSG